MTSQTLTAPRNMSTASPWLVTFSAALSFFFEFIQMNMFNAIDAGLMHDFSLNATQLGQLSATYFYANVLFLLPAGIIIDRFSTKKVIIVAMGFCVFGTLLFAFANIVEVAYLCRFLTGIGSSFCFLSCFRIASRWFPAHKLAYISGLIVTMAMVGGMLAQAPLTILVQAVGWRNALVYDAFLGAFITGIIVAFVQDFPEGTEEVALENNVNQLGFWRSLQMAYGRLQNWLCAAYTCLLNLPLGVLGVVWGVPYISGVYGFTTTQASLITSMLFLGTIFGSPIVGRLSDHLGQRRLPMLLCAVFSLIAVAVLLIIEEPSFLVLVGLFLCIGFFTSGQVLSYPAVTEGNSPLVTAMAVSTVSLGVQGGDAIFQAWFGSLVHSQWQGLYHNHVPVYSASAYQYAFSMIPIAFILAIIITLLIKETHCRQKV